MSELKVDKITPRLGTTLTLGDSGDTINFGSGVLPNFENLTVTGDLTVDTNSLKVDSTNNYVGIGTATPSSALDIVGNIVVSGTVDGRDIATDGTKLDTIATNATANPNAIDNVVEDTTPQLGGNLDLNSNDITGTGNINITGTIESSGNITGTLATAAQPNITSVGTLTSATVSGDLTVDTNTLSVDSTNRRVGVGTASPSTHLHVTGSSTAQLRGQNGAEYFELLCDSTNSIFSSTGPIFLRTNNADPIIFQYSTSSEAMRIDSSGNVGIGTSSPSTKLDINGDLKFGTSASRNYLGDFGTVNSYLINYNATGTLLFYVGGGTGGNERVKISTGEFAINEQSNDYDFRVESNNNSNMLFVDGGSDEVGVGVNPSDRFHVSGGTAMTGSWNRTIRLDAIYPCLIFESTYSNGFGGIGYDSGSTSPMVFWTGGTSEDVHGTGERALMLGESGGTTVFNEDSTDTDFRVETNNNTHALFVNGGNDQVEYYISRQRVLYSGSFPSGTPTTVVDLSSLASSTYTGARIRAHGGENSYRNVSYGEWVAVRSFSGSVDHWVLQSTGQATDGNNYGTVVLSMSGSNLQVISGSGVGTGTWRISIELFN